MACCLTAPNPYLNQCWFLIIEVRWHSPGSNFTARAQATILHNEFENYTYKIILLHLPGANELTHWGRVTSVTNHHWFRQWLVAWPAPCHYLNHAGLSLIGPLGTNFSEILIEILKFSFKKRPLKVSSAKRRPFCVGLNVLMDWMFSNNIS